MAKAPEGQSLPVPGEHAGLGARLKGPQTGRNIKRETSIQEVLHIESRTSRSGRVLKAPTAYAPAPVTTTDKRRRTARKNNANIICVKCQRGNSPNNNMIVFCDGCNATWHQKCHDPPIDDEVVKTKDTEWYCHTCKPVPRPAKTKKYPIKALKPGRIVHPRLQRAPRLDVGGEHFTSDERRAYLSCLSHAALVELLVNVSSYNPSVPIFPANLRELPASEFPSLLPQPPISMNIDLSLTNTTEVSKQKKRSLEVSATIAELGRTSGSLKKPRTISAPSNADGTIDAHASLAAGEDAAAVINAPQRPRTNSAPSVRITQNYSKARIITPSQKIEISNKLWASVLSPTAYAPVSKLESPSNTSPVAVSQGARAFSHTDPESETDNDSEEEEEEEEDDDDDDDDKGFEEVEDHRLYPSAGSGFCPSDHPADLDILREESGYRTFSHGLHGAAKQVETNKMPVGSWGGRLRKLLL